MVIKSYSKKSGKYKVKFQIPCEQLPEDVTASQINIVASFNNWSITETPMQVADGIGFEKEVSLNPGRYEFRYLINDQHWYNDWEADGYESNRLQNADNCILVLDEVVKPNRSSKKGDDLKKIEGIGPKISKVLNNAGVTSFAQLSKMDEMEIREILTGKVRIFHPATWPQQAALAAAGKWEKLKEFQGSLVGGRVK